MFRKQLKALQLLLNFVESKLNDKEHSSEFFATLLSFLSNQSESSSSTTAPDDDLTMSSVKQLLDNLISLYISREVLFSSDEIFQLQTWYLLYSVKNSLCCDDSFRFSKACQTLEKFFENDEMFPPFVSVTEGYEKDDEITSNHLVTVSLSFFNSRVDATLQCLSAALPLYTRHQWARQPLDKVFDVVSSRRLRLGNDSQRDELDILTNKITLEKRKIISGKPAQTFRTYNSTAHPLKTKQVGLLR